MGEAESKIEEALAIGPGKHVLFPSWRQGLTI